MSAYYNENDPKAAAWLRELIKAGAIATGDVDERDVRDIRPSDLEGFTQHHFFAGIGGWSYALRLAGWDDLQPVWTGSCPCQPFSAAGQGGGFADERHLWPAWFHLIEQCHPAVIFGEQVASPDGLGWLDVVYTDLEATGHTFAAVDLCAAGVGAPHIRQRLYFVGHLHDSGSQGRSVRGNGAHQWTVRTAGMACQLDNSSRTRGRRHPGTIPAAKSGSERRLRSQPHQLEPPSTAGNLDNTTIERWGEGSPNPAGIPTGDRAQGLTTGFMSDSYVNGHWQNSEWIWCRDQKYRPVEPGSFPLAHGVPARVGRLRGYGNAIVAQQAAAFIEAYTLSLSGAAKTRDPNDR